ncbi:hypothetical protein BROUX41_001021 [Berkeleyomyces rouxiae]|uniref:uncharacterized protein n=1 Tax=Berkeleyomyces rouxiae TaxID=2035830 RepID=UPI003B7C992B
MLSSSLLASGFALYAAQLLTLPIAFPMYFSLAFSVVTAVSRALGGNVSPAVPPVFVCTFALTVLVNICRLRGMGHRPRGTSQNTVSKTRSNDSLLYTVIVLGSGGHTKEMLYMMSQGFKASPNAHRRYLICSGDRLSISHLEEWESDQQRALTHNQDFVATQTKSPTGTFDVITIPRARKIHQSLLSTPFTAATSVMMLAPALLKRPQGRNDLGLPDLIISNGPATGFFTVLTAFGLRALALVPEAKMRSLYVESWARISTLSITGKLFRLTGIADRVVVQHGELARKHGLENAGWLVLERRGQVQK